MKENIGCQNVFPPQIERLCLSTPLLRSSQMDQKRILLVEDNPEHVELTLEALLECGVDHSQIEVAVDGVEALAYLFCTGRHSARDIEEQPQVVMLDMHLPKVGGDEVLRRMRAEPATFFVPVVMFTDHYSRFASLYDHEGGLTTQTSKPITAAALRDRLEAIEDYWRTSRFSPLPV